MSPNDEAWERFKQISAAVPYEWTDLHRAAFDAGVRHGIKFTMNQIGWVLQDRAAGLEEQPR